MDVDRIRPLDVGRALIRDVGEPRAGVDAELLEEVLSLLGLVLLRRLRVGLGELLEELGAHLVRLALILDVRVVLGGDHGPVEADAGPALRTADIRRQVELGEGGRIVRVGLERTVEGSVEAPRLLSLHRSIRADVELAARDLGGVVEGLVKDLLRVLVVAAAPAATACDDRRQWNCDRQYCDQGSDARQS